jgi:hypothetical protein
MKRSLVPVIGTEGAVAELHALHECTQSALRKWRRMPDGVPAGHANCRLAEAIGGQRCTVAIATSFPSKQA